MQVVGKKCAICSEKILTITEGLSCPTCTKCYHDRCVSGGQCPDDGGVLQCQERKPDDWRRGAFVPGSSSRSHLPIVVLVGSGLLILSAAGVVWLIQTNEGQAGLHQLSIALGATLGTLIGAALLICLIRR